MLTKLVAGLFAAAVFYGTWYARQASAKRRLREIDAGTRCIACDRTDLTRTDGFARCNACGHKVALASLQAVVLSSAEIAQMTKPDDRSL
jgi:ribosomal protein L37AE/L43A